MRSPFHPGSAPSNPLKVVTVTLDSGFTLQAAMSAAGIRRYPQVPSSHRDPEPSVRAAPNPEHGKPLSAFKTLHVPWFQRNSPRFVAPQTIPAESTDRLNILTGRVMSRPKEKMSAAPPG